MQEARYCQLDWCFEAARRAVIRKGRTTSVHHIWQSLPNMVTSTSKYGSRGRPLGALCTTARPYSRPNIGATEARTGDLTAGRGNGSASRFFHAVSEPNRRPVDTVALRRTSFLRRRRALVGSERGAAARSDTRTHRPL